MKSAGNRSRFRFTCSFERFAVNVQFCETGIQHHLVTANEENSGLDSLD